jgi:hypothetical protein
MRKGAKLNVRLRHGRKFLPLSGLRQINCETVKGQFRRGIHILFMRNMYNALVVPLVVNLRDFGTIDSSSLGIGPPYARRRSPAS